MAAKTDLAFQKCISPRCGTTYGIDEVRVQCDGVRRPVGRGLRLGPGSPPPIVVALFEQKWSRRYDPLCFSGVWRFHELLPFAPPSQIVTIGEGQTLLQPAPHVARFVGIEPDGLFLQYEGMNPSGSFKDNGMSAAFTHARTIGASRAACASTGNTSASLAAYCSVTRADEGRDLHRLGQDLVRQAVAGARLWRPDRADRRRFRRRDGPRQGSLAASWASTWSTASIPSGWKGRRRSCIACWKGLRWQVPDWIVVPGGNLGNSSAFGKAFAELREIGLIDRVPRLAVINAAGANTLYELYERRGLRWNGGSPNRRSGRTYYGELDRAGRRASTIASAIEINRPVNLNKCLRALETCDGVVREVTDQEIMDAKAQVGAGGLGCEPASAASVAGARLLRHEGVIGPDERVVCILTGHQLKDPTATVAYHTTDQDKFNEVLGSRGVQRAAFANRAVAVPNDLDEIVKAIQLYS